MADNIIRRGQLRPKTGYSPQYIYELISAGKFPRPIRLGANAVGWLESEIDAWQKERISARDKVEA